ncbi:uncharacterized protein PHACADRAFT_246190 [Phanerochaete carnosa HHB-10118-sp]|uniref:Uncharacterized protein n=1 Tax=Phanerochaete carnosa (strain HHB-10118-sp) TaxID=650164 RepID=K5WME1_PHACS|nr:uncharacterized protein PHACADRAFT_246190 [Phanerochaete carnosa HHB-10118-sp]EKM60329.1 hypothetical protein PHACADRAFT_246190 [Phanerochaete carnosa HHB-10118-sp]
MADLRTASRTQNALFASTHANVVAPSSAPSYPSGHHATTPPSQPSTSDSPYMSSSSSILSIPPSI